MTLSLPAATSTILNDTEGVRSSGSSPPRAPSIHLVGAGKVGRAFLRQLAATGWPLVGVTDSTATLFSREGLGSEAIAHEKESGRAFAQWPRGERLPIELAFDLVHADVVVDATPTDLANATVAVRRVRAALRSGSRVALAAKDALSEAADSLLGEGNDSRVGCNAALGGTGVRLVEELASLRASCASVALVANATTTLVLEAVEKGASIDEGIHVARGRGLLEADPTLDLDGSDAAVKLAIVARAVFRGDARPGDAARVDLRSIDPVLVRARAKAGRTTRLVARASREGELRLGYEELPRTSPLVAPFERVVYAYALRGGATRVHLGAGVGPEATARELVRDVRALVGIGGAR